MQNDITTKFGDIFNSREQLLEKIEHIIDVAGVEADDNGPFQLRFLTPLSPLGDWHEDDDACDYRVTQPEEHVNGMNYITVSYRWQHSQALDGLPQIPEYRIWEGSTSGTSRPLKCPKIVFHRAVQFAKLKGCPYIWIDQECIDQTNMNDIEQHLQIMHRVYSESRWTAAILSVGICTNAQLEDLVNYVYEGVVYSQRPIIRSPVISLLKMLAEDPYFKRTWTYQERSLANSLQMLVPLDPSIAVPGKYGGFVTTFDLCIDYYQFSNTLQFHCYYICKEAKRDEIDTAELQELFIVSKVLAVKVYTQYAYKERDFNQNFLTFLRSSMCHNSVVSDRPNIIGTINKFPLRLLSTRLNSPKYSLSAAVLALHMMNWYHSREQREQFLFSHPLKEFNKSDLEEILFSKYFRKLTGHGEVAEFLRKFG